MGKENPNKKGCGPHIPPQLELPREYVGQSLMKGIKVMEGMSNFWKSNVKVHLQMARRHTMSPMSNFWKSNVNLEQEMARRHQVTNV